MPIVKIISYHSPTTVIFVTCLASSIFDHFSSDKLCGNYIGNWDKVSHLVKHVFHSQLKQC